MLAKFQKLSLFLLLILIPTQLGLHFWPKWSFVYGLPIDLLAPTLFCTDILTGFLVLTNFRMFTPYAKYLAGLLIFSFINICFSVIWQIAFFKWIKIFEMVLLVIFLSKQNLVRTENIYRVLFYGSVFFALLGIAQFFLGKTLGGPLYFLGERTFNSSTPGIALVSIGGVDHLRAYSSFSHPNSLAGYLGAILIITLLSGKINKSTINSICTIIITLGLLLTFSASAYFAILISLLFLLIFAKRRFVKHSVLLFLLVSVVLSLLLPLYSLWIAAFFKPIAESVTQRLDLAYMAGELISKNFFTGVGMGNFIVNIPGLKGIFTYSWLLQPVHNIYLLIASEGGVVAVFIFTVFIYKVFMKSLKDKKFNLVLALIFLLFAGLFDHYLLSLQQNLISFSLIAGLAFHKTGQKL